ncbi:hypothetical protein [Sinorhizobium americanum]|uniref:hypothetical protein n=1 Tax=Sinorhizobium americanum TaxID=194963 RepID=UPI0012EC08C7|nr:hypothetical protein [Sinorhizobium americanum]
MKKIAWVLVGLVIVLWLLGCRFVEVNPAEQGQGRRTVVGLNLYGYWPWDNVVSRCEARLANRDQGLDPNGCSQQLTDAISKNWLVMTVWTAKPPEVF